LSTHDFKHDLIVLPVKPFSVNDAWKGRRFRTDEYDAYHLHIKLILPKRIVIPKGRLMIVFDFYFSSKTSDWDNPIKPLQDIICATYGLNDNNIYTGIVRKFIVKKGEERTEFRLYEFTEENQAIISDCINNLK